MSAVQYIFFGKVHPERCNVSIAELHTQVKSLDGDVDGVVHHSISLSQVTATFVGGRPVQNIYTLKNTVEDVIRVALDALGYTLACGYDLEIIQMIDSVGNPPVVFGVGISAIENSAARAGVKFENIVSIFGDGRGQYLSVALPISAKLFAPPKTPGSFVTGGSKVLGSSFFRK